jgi:hypothetical protein
MLVFHCLSNPFCSTSDLRMAQWNTPNFKQLFVKETSSVLCRWCLQKARRTTNAISTPIAGNRLYDRWNLEKECTRVLQNVNQQDCSISRLNDYHIKTRQKSLEPKLNSNKNASYNKDSNSCHQNTSMVQVHLFLYTLTVTAKPSSDKPTWRIIRRTTERPISPRFLLIYRNFISFSR